METEEIVTRLRACLGERVPGVDERRELASALRAWSAPGSALTDSVHGLSATIEQSSVRRELAVAAAHAMRLLMQAAAEQRAPEPPPVRRSSAERARGRAERS